MFGIEAATYSPSLRFKKGEYLALRALDEAIKDLTLPHLIIPPISARDTEMNRRLSLEEFFPVQIGRISQNWGSRACLVDTRFVEFAPGAAEDGERLLKFFSSASKFACSAIPVFDLSTSSNRLDAIRRHWLETQCGLALRVSFLDLGRQDLSSSIRKLLLRMVAKPSEVALVFDLSGVVFDDQDEEFSRSVLVWLGQLQEIGLWRRIIVTWSSYPFKNPALANSSATVLRKEWKIWKAVVALDRRVDNFCMFGDFGADNSKIQFKGGGLPITHLRYTLGSDWLVVRGGESSSGVEGGNGTLKEVSRKIVDSGFFAGEAFSAGDEFIADCAAGRCSLGSASEWRRANMNHHITRVIVDLAALDAKVVPVQKTRRTPIQTEFAL